MYLSTKYSCPALDTSTIFMRVETSKSRRNALILLKIQNSARTWKLYVAEMRMLRWMSGVTKLDRIMNERIRGTTKVEEISKKVQESRLTRYGHVLRREYEYVGKRVMGMEVPGKRRRGRPKRRWLDNIKNDLVGVIIVSVARARPG